MRNLKLAFRTLFKTPFVTVVAILSLALGIGANAAIYSLFNEMLLAAAAGAAAGAAGELRREVRPRTAPERARSGGDTKWVFSYPMFRDLEGETRRSAASPATFSFGVNVAMPGQTPINGRGLFVSGSYFPRPRRHAGARPPAHAINDDQVDRRTLRRRAELRVLGDAARRRSRTCVGQADHGERPSADDHRRRARGIQRHDARRTARTSSSRSRCAAC